MNSLTVPATLESLEAVHAFVAQAASAAGLDAEAAYRLRLAADEIATNIILYAYPGAAAPGTIDLRAEVDDRTLALVLEDTGIPFDPLKVPPPADLHLPLEQRKLGGLGIYVARRNVDRFAYERAGERNRNVLVLQRPPQSTS
jgi:anti-sigma regulatory factor (Ser/Thr protein kinase)